MRGFYSRRADLLRCRLSIRARVVRLGSGSRHGAGDERKGDDSMKQYLLSVYQPDGPRPAPERLDRIMRDVRAVRDEMKAAGAWVFSAGLHPPSTATVLRAQEEGVLMTDGPFVEGKEHLGGFTIVKSPDLDAALGWGKKLARATTLPIEVRPFHDEAES